MKDKLTRGDFKIIEGEAVFVASETGRFLVGWNTPKKDK
jgi:hypothetical protein